MGEIEIGRRLPETFVEQHLGMTNCDHSIDKGFGDILKDGGYFGRHAGWNFNGLVWFQAGQFHEEVWVYRVYQETVSAKTLEELMCVVSNKYGWK